jgi:flagellar basal body P-ring formation protein FlgA
LELSMNTRVAPVSLQPGLVRRAGFVFCAMLVPLVALAQTMHAPNLGGATTGVGLTDDYLRMFVAQRVQPAGSPTASVQRVEVKFGVLDSRVQLAPCAQIDPYVPPGARLWGRTAIGVRCVSGASWNILLPVTVSIWGTAWAAATPLAAGTLVSSQDFRMQEVEWSREAAPPIVDASEFAGRTLLRSLQEGQPVRKDMLRTPPVLVSGDTVTLRISGAGFSISGQGQALSSAGEGQPVRIRTEQGRFLSGTARAGKTVEIAL